MAIALVSVTDLAATVVALPAADRAVDLVVTALVPDPVAPVVMALVDLAAMIVVAMTAALLVSKTNRSSVPSSPALSSRMTRSSRSSVAR
jgi:hypothetical protein